MTPALLFLYFLKYVEIWKLKFVNGRKPGKHVKDMCNLEAIDVTVSLMVFHG